MQASKPIDPYCSMHNAIYKHKQLIVVTGSEILRYLVTVSGIYLQDLTTNFFEYYEIYIKTTV